MSNQALEQWDQAQQAASPITVEELDEWGRKWKEATEAHEAAKKVASEKYKILDEIEGKFVEALKQAGRNKYYVEGIGLIGFNNRMSVQTPKTIEEKKALAKYIQDTYGATVFWDKFSINSQTLQGFYKKEYELFEERCEADPNYGVQNPFHIPGLAPPVATTGLKKLSKDKGTKQGETE